MVRAFFIGLTAALVMASNVAAETGELSLLIPTTAVTKQQNDDSQEYEPRVEKNTQLVQYGLQYTLDSKNNSDLLVLSAGVSDFSKRAVGVSIQTTW